MRDWPLVPVRQQPEVEGNVIKVDGHRSHQRRDIKAARRIDETDQDHQAQGCGGQMGNLIERAGTQQTKWNRAVGRVEAQRDPGQQQGVGPHPEPTLLTWPHPPRLPAPPEPGRPLVPAERRARSQRLFQPRIEQRTPPPCGSWRADSKPEAQLGPASPPSGTHSWVKMRRVRRPVSRVGQMFQTLPSRVAATRRRRVGPRHP